MKTQTITQIVKLKVKHQSSKASEPNEPSTPINISSDKCVCSCHKEIEQLKSETDFFHQNIL